MKMTFRCIREARECNHLLSPEAKDRLETMTKALDKWLIAFDLSLAESALTRTHKEVRAAINLRILNIVAKIWLVSVQSAEESIFDQQTEAFSSIVSLAATMNEDVPPLPKASALNGGGAGNSDPRTIPNVSSSQNKTDSSRPATHTSAFAFEMGVIPPLYFTAIKCRVPSIRRSAIALLQTTMPRREGIWIADLYIALARRIIEIEEGDFEARHLKSDGGAIRDQLTGELLPPKSRRVIDAAIHLRTEKGLAERVKKVTFLMRPFGAGGRVVAREEVISW